MKLPRILVLVGLSGAAAGIDVLTSGAHGGGHGLHGLPGFELAFGLSACALLVLVAKVWLGALIGRREDYYQEGKE